MSMIVATRRVALLVAFALAASLSAAAVSGAQEAEPLPPGVPEWNWEQLITSPATVWACKSRVERRGESVWRVNLLAKSKETEWNVSASARFQRWPRKRTLDDWSSGILAPGEHSPVGRVVADGDRNDKIVVGAGHRNGPYEGMGLGGEVSIRGLNRC